jgi:hypothetical protein
MNPVLFLLMACKEEVVPNGIWNVTITGTGSENPCVESTEGFQQSYEYALYNQSNFVEIDVDGEFFATGEIRGCTMTYESGVYLDEAQNGPFRWKINGIADVESAGGGCPDVPDEYDWFGTETLTVISSENIDIEEGCSYSMDSTGVLIK